MKRGVYLGGSFRQKDVIAARKNRLVALGVPINSTWTAQKSGANLTEEFMTEIARRDMSELLASSLVIIDATVASSTNGLHSEAGAAAASGIELWIVGHKDDQPNVFFRFARRWFDQWSDAEAALLEVHNLARTRGALSALTPSSHGGAACELPSGEAA